MKKLLISCYAVAGSVMTIKWFSHPTTRSSLHLTQPKMANQQKKIWTSIFSVYALFKLALGATAPLAPCKRTKKLDYKFLQAVRQEQPDFELPFNLGEFHPKFLRKDKKIYQEFVKSVTATLLHSLEAELQVDWNVNATLLVGLNGVKPAQNLNQKFCCYFQKQSSLFRNSVRGTFKNNLAYSVILSGVHCDSR